MWNNELSNCHQAKRGDLEDDSVEDQEANDGSILISLIGTSTDNVRNGKVEKLPY